MFVFCSYRVCCVVKSITYVKKNVTSSLYVQTYPLSPLL